MSSKGREGHYRSHDHMTSMAHISTILPQRGTTNILHYSRIYNSTHFINEWTDAKSLPKSPTSKWPSWDLPRSVWVQILYSQPILAGTNVTTSLPPFPSVTTQVPQRVQGGLLVLFATGNYLFFPGEAAWSSTRMDLFSSERLDKNPPSHPSLGHSASG